MRKLLQLTFITIGLLSVANAHFGGRGRRDRFNRERRFGGDQQPCDPKDGSCPDGFKCNTMGTCVPKTIIERMSDSFGLSKCSNGTCAQGEKCNEFGYCIP